MNSSGFISHNMILSEVATKSGDREFNYDSEGYYTSLIQEALSELSFDTFFSEKEKVYDIEGEDCLKLEIPSGFFNIKNIIGFSGKECNPSDGRKIYFKRNYRNKLARDNWGNKNDPYYKERGKGNPPGNLYFCGIYSGIIELSKSCSIFDKVSVRANGLITNIGEDPIIPIFFRQAVVDYAVVEAISVRIANNPMAKEANIWGQIMNRHENRLRMQYDGSWDKARHRVKVMDSKTREDIREYMSQFDY